MSMPGMKTVFLRKFRERTGLWAWKHPHKDGTLTYTELKGDVVMDGVDFGYTEKKTGAS